VKLVKFNSLEGMKGLNFINVAGVIFNQKKIKLHLLLLISLFLVSCENKSLKTGYIDINQINKEFKLAIQYDKHIKKLEKEIALKISPLKVELDLFEEKITTLSSSKEEIPQNILENFYRLRHKYSLEEKNAHQIISDSVELYREKLNAQINKHVYDYAQKNGFDYVYSPAGTGTFMYADSSLNITKEVIYYLNSRQLHL
tara:strand:- start:5 stop:604 length:600 start_codon:yes stop_codon:yes gene_type:complete